MAASFEAWALPAGTRAAGARTVRDDRSGSVARVDATPAWVDRLCDDLVAARAELLRMPARDIADALGRVGARFLHPGDALRETALRSLPATSGLSAEMCEVVLEGMAREWDAGRLRALLDREFGDPGVLDGLVEVEPGVASGVRAPGLCFQIVSGSVPGVSATALVRSLLVKAPTLVKPGLGDVVLPVLFARGLAEVEPRLAAAAAVVYWPGGSPALEEVALSRARVVVAYGGDDTVRSVRDRTPISARFVPYHHRISVGAVGREAVVEERVLETAMDVARAVAVFDQRGCVSPHVVWAEEGGDTAPEAFAELVAEALAEIEELWPSGRLDVPEASAVQQARGAAELERAAGREVRVWSGGADPWTVIYEGVAEGPARACVGRLVRVRPIDALSSVPARMARFEGHLQTVALAASATRIRELARGLASAGATRVTSFPCATFPPAWWKQDGRGVLKELTEWCEVEGPRQPRG